MGEVRSVCYRELTREEIGEIAPRATAVLPVAAIEQHGPHLPVWVDALVAERLALAAGERIADSAPVVICPTVSFGASHHHLVFPGALSLSRDTLLRVLADLTDSLVSSGFRSIFILNCHGGNEEVVRMAARELVLRHSLAVGAGSYWTIAWESLIDGGAGDVGRVPGHAGGFETSLMLALEPELVRRERLPSSHGGVVSGPPVEPTGLPLTLHSGSWKAADGYSDDASRASGEHGERFFEGIVNRLADHLLRFHRRALGEADVQ
ncbi:MAG: creatininase family protein [Trueperaceae bacterium]